MSKEIKKDLRIQRTKEKIKGSFLTIVKKQSFDSISVKDLCTKAQISRSTFYTHYDNTAQLLDEIIDEILSHITIDAFELNNKQETCKLCEFLRAHHEYQGLFRDSFVVFRFADRLFKTSLHINIDYLKEISGLSDTQLETVLRMQLNGCIFATFQKLDASDEEWKEICTAIHKNFSFLNNIS